MSASASNGLAYALALRLELSFRNQKYAAKHELPHALSYGEQPVVCFEPYEGDRRHGNFLPQTYRAILDHDNWRRRLLKPHSQARTALPRTRRWNELDSSNSSDALLMNVFCYPGVFRDGRLYTLLGVDGDCIPEFGFKARVPFAASPPAGKNGGSPVRRFDRTEVDMRLGALLVEAKLTETDFQAREPEVVEAYCEFAEVFDIRALPRLTPSGEYSGAVRRRGRDRYSSYQLIRNVLAAHATGCSFCVLADARRPDLIQAWYEVMRCVRNADLRVRCKVLTWQELASAVPRRLQHFLGEKYGILTGQGIAVGEGA